MVKPTVIARRHAEAIQCRSLSKTGSPRFLAEPRNDSESQKQPSPGSLAEPRNGRETPLPPRKNAGNAVSAVTAVANCSLQGRWACFRANLFLYLRYACVYGMGKVSGVRRVRGFRSAHALYIQIN